MRSSWIPVAPCLALGLTSTAASARASEDPAPLATPAPAPEYATPASPAPAPTPPGEALSLDEVRLRDGGIIRGTILDLQPEVAVTIQRAVDGTSITYAWTEVSSAHVASPAAPTPAHAPASASDTVAASTPSSTPVPDTPESGRGLPRLTIKTRSRRPVHLFTTGDSPMLMATTSSSSTTMTTTTSLRGGVALRSVCQAPCGEVIDARAGYPYFFGGDRMPISRPVYLNYTEGDVTVEVHPGRYGLLLGGVFGISYGAVGALTGGALLGVAPDTLAKPGGILLGTGAALLVSGIVMVVHGRTRYRIRK